MSPRQLQDADIRYIPVIPALRRLRQKNCRFQPSLSEMCNISPYGPASIFLLSVGKDVGGFRVPGGEWLLEGGREPDPILPCDPHWIGEASGWKGRAPVVMTALPTLIPLRVGVGGLMPGRS